MSLLSSFIMSHIISALEQQFVAHVPEMQQAFLGEVSALVNEVSTWVESKMPKPEGAPANEEKN